MVSLMNKDDVITAVLGQLQQQLAQGSGLEWRLGSGALLQCWKPYKGDFFNGQTANRGAHGMHHYEGAVAGAEELVSVEFADGEVLDYRKLSKSASLLGPLRSCERSSGSGRRRQRRRRQPATSVRPQKLRAKKQAAEAVAAAAAERESGTVCSELEDGWFSGLVWEDCASEGFSRPPPGPPPELLDFNQHVHEAVFGDADTGCCGDERTAGSLTSMSSGSSDDDGEPAAGDRTIRGLALSRSPSTVLGLLEEGEEGGSEWRECGGDVLLSPDSVFEMDLQRWCEAAPGEGALPWAPSQRTPPCA